MSITSPPFVLEVQVGKEKPSALPADLAAALMSAEISVSDTPPSGFQLVFSTTPSTDDNDHDLLQEDLLAEFNRVVLEMHVGEESTRLMDGFITNRELDPSAGKLVVTGEDLSVKLDLFEVCWEYKDLKDSEIVNKILGRYDLFKSNKKVEAATPESKPDPENIPRQLDTDRKFLLKLAKKNDRVFYIKYDGEKSIAYWGPREPGPKQEQALVSSTLTFGNVEKMSPKYNALAAVLYYGSKFEDKDGNQEEAAVQTSANKLPMNLSKVPPPLKTLSSSLGADPESFYEKLSTLNIRGKYLKNQAQQAQDVAKAEQSATSEEVSEAATVDGELDSAKYGDVLQVRGKVGVRGLGTTFDGEYYVQSVTHDMVFRGEVKYMQKFKLTREGLDSKESKV